MLYRVMITMAVIFLSVTGTGTTVEWGQMKSVDAEVWDTGPVWQIWGYSQQNFGLTYEFFVTTDWGGLSASDKFSPNTTIWVRQASAGDVVDHDSMLGEGQTYFYKGEKGVSGIVSDYDIPLEWGETAYLAMAVVAYDIVDPYLAYGWAEVGLGNDGPTVVSSAWDVDGGAMYVGGGAVPEPTAAMLLLLGVAGLALRRRREEEFLPKTGVGMVRT